MCRNNSSSAQPTLTLLPSASQIALDISSKNPFDLVTDPSFELVEDEAANESEAPEQSGKFAIYADPEEMLDDAEVVEDSQECEMEIEEWELGETNWAGQGDLVLTQTAELDSLLAEELDEVEQPPANEVEEIEAIELVEAAEEEEEELSAFETEPHPSDFCVAAEIEPATVVIDELPDEDVVEVSPETTVSLNDSDLEILDVQATVPRSAPVLGEKILIRVRAGETLPPNMVPADDELPRFTLGRKAVRGSAGMQENTVGSIPGAALPQFGLAAAQGGRPRLPPVILPRFPITDTNPAIFLRRPPLPPVRMPRSFRSLAMHSYAMHCTCHECQQAMALLAAARSSYR